MAINATISSVNKTGNASVSVGVTYSDGSGGEFVFPLPALAADIRATIKAEVTRRNTIDAQVIDVAKLLGVVIGPV